MLTSEELAYWASRYRGPNPGAAIQYAQELAKAYVEQHAADMLPSIQHGIYRSYFRAVLEGDPGESRLLRISIDCMLELGRNVNANSRT